MERDINKLSYPLDFDYLKLADPTFKAFFAKEKTADEKQAEPLVKNVQHLKAKAKAKAKAERKERNRDKRKKTLCPSN